VYGIDSLRYKNGNLVLAEKDEAIAPITESMIGSEEKKERKGEHFATVIICTLRITVTKEKPFAWFEDNLVMMKNASY